MEAKDMPYSQNGPQDMPDLTSMPILIGLTVKGEISHFKRIYYSPEQGESWTLTENNRSLTPMLMGDVKTIDIHDEAPTDHGAIKHVTEVHNLGDNIVLENEYDGTYHIFVLREPKNADVYFVTTGPITYEGETSIVSTADIIRYDSFTNIPNTKPAPAPAPEPAPAPVAEIETLDVEQNKFNDNDYQNDITAMENFMKTLKGGQPASTQSQDTTPAEKYSHYMNTFAKLIDIIITMPIVFKLNSLTTKGLTQFIDRKDVGIQTVPDQNVKFTPKNAPIQLLFDFLFVPMSKLDDLKMQKSKEYLNRAIDSMKNEADRTNYSTINALFGKPAPSAPTMHAKRFCEFALDQNYSHLETEQVGMETIAYFFYSTIHKQIGLLTQLVPQIQNFENQYNGTFKKTLDAIIADANSNQILTFLKMTNFENKSGLYNQRFHVRLNTTIDKTPNMMILDYNDDPFPYYVFTSQGAAIPNVAELTKPENQGRFTLGSGNQVLSSVKSYDATFLFGKFQEVFPPQLTNGLIAKRPNIGAMLAKIEEGSPVFLMGYGASGSGKTSSLIYFKGTNTVAKEDGMLIELCKALAAKGYDSLSVTVKEYFITKSQSKPVVGQAEAGPGAAGPGAAGQAAAGQATAGQAAAGQDVRGQNTLDSPLVHSRGPFTFSTGPRGGFTLTEESTQSGSYTFLHTYRTVSMDVPGKNTKNFGAGTGLGEVLIQLIDTDRLVKATTNNPNSSRSHTLVFITLKKSSDGGLANIIVGDFAGVENEFKCESPLVLQQFLNVKRESPGDDNDALYYSVEPKRANIKDGDDPVTFDPIYGGNSSSLSHGDGKQTSLPQLGGSRFDNWDHDKLVLKLQTLKDQETRTNQDNLDISDIEYLLKNAPNSNPSTEQSIAQNPQVDQSSPDAKTPHWVKQVKATNQTANIVLENSNPLKPNPLKPDDSTNPALKYVQTETPLYDFENFDTDATFPKPANENQNGPKKEDILNYVFTQFRIPIMKYSNDAIYNVISKLKEESVYAEYSNISKKLENNITIMSAQSAGGDFNAIVKQVLYRKFLNAENDEQYLKSIVPVKEKMKKLQTTITTEVINHVDFNQKSRAYLTEYTDYTDNKRIKKDDLLKDFKNIAKCDKKGTDLSCLTDKLSFDLISRNRMTFKDEIAYLEDYLNKNMPEKILKSTGNKILNYYGEKIRNIALNYKKYQDADENKKADINFQKEFEKSYAFYTVDYKADGTSYIFPIKIRHRLNFEFYKNLEKELAIANLFDGLALLLVGISVSPGTETKIDDINHKFNTIRELTLDKIKPFYDRIYDMIIETKYRLQYGANICVNRRTEGAFINDSLTKIRETIREILVAKTEDVIFPLPNFIDICMDTYCPTHKNCFQFDDPPVNNTGAIPSLLFADIRTYLIELGGKTYADKNAFYKDIIVAVFCVFNISRRANNPPPVPYIDINKLKQLFFYEKDNVNDLSTEIFTLAKRLSKFPTLLIELAKPLDQVMEIAKTSEQLKENSTLKSLIDAIDKNNAASAVGTLEFLDQIAKFNTTNHICYSHENPHLDETQITFYKSDAFSQEIYPKK